MIFFNFFFSQNNKISYYGEGSLNLLLQQVQQQQQQQQQQQYLHFESPYLCIYSSTENSMESIQVRFMGVLIFIVGVLFILYQDLLSINNYNFSFSYINNIYYPFSGDLDLVNILSTILVNNNLLFLSNSNISLFFKILIQIQIIVKFISFIIYIFFYFFFNIFLNIKLKLFSIYYLKTVLFQIFFFSCLFNHIIASICHTKKFTFVQNERMNKIKSKLILFFKEIKSKLILFFKEIINNEKEILIKTWLFVKIMIIKKKNGLR